MKVYKAGKRMGKDIIHIKYTYSILHTISHYIMTTVYSVSPPIPTCKGSLASVF